MTTIATAEQLEAFQAILAERGCATCACGRVLDEGDCAWNNGETESGTPSAVLEIICTQCGEETARVETWWPNIDDFGEFVAALDHQIDDKGWR